MTPQQPPLILASQSIYRQQLLHRLQLNFQCIAPNINETPSPNEEITDLVLRLGIEKANTIAKQHPNAFIIASDQSANCDGMPLGKPGNLENALTQLTQMQGKAVIFYTSLVLKTPETTFTHIDKSTVHFRHLSQTQLRHYILQEQPYQCAGAFKSEGLGACLFERIDNQDPSAIIGLPIIKLAHWLTDLGLLLR